jgi:hypothetical protein
MRHSQRMMNKVDWRYYRGCVGKIGYPTKAQAKRRLKILNLVDGSCYKCSYCGKHHISSHQ